MTHLTEVLIKQGRIKSDKVTEIVAKDEKQKKVKEKYNKATDKERFSKAELRSIIEDLL